jgi:hypothetical protein
MNSTGFSNANSNSTRASVSTLSAAGISGVSIGATALTVFCAAALFTCRKRRLARQTHRRRLHDAVEGAGKGDQDIHAHTPLGTKVIVSIPVDLTEDHTGDEDDDDPQDDMHFDCILAVYSVISGNTPSDHGRY